MTLLWVALGAGVGAPLRYLVDRIVRSRHGSAFPWGTLVVNVAGSLLLGFVVALPAAAAVLAAVGPGFCGAFTTYSTLSYETLRLAHDRSHLLACVNLLVSVVAGVGAAFGGVWLAQACSPWIG